jgi:hypothetical protein
MISFGSLWNIMEVESSGDTEDRNNPLMTSGDDSQAMEAIRNGLHLRKEGCPDFWEDFITICGNADAMSELLEVPRDKVTGWAGKIRGLVENVDKKDDEQKAISKKSKMIATGDGEIPDIFGNDAGVDMRPSPS